ncbi:MAG: hypothetical protein AMXMBFR81_00480 [Chthonomonas sp.]
MAPLDMAEAAWARGDLEQAAHGYEIHLRRAGPLDDVAYPRRQALRCLTAIGERALELGDVGAAVKAFVRAVALGPAYPDLKRKLAAALAASGQHKEARRLLDLAIEANPGYAFARVDRAVMDFAAGYCEEALHEIEEACRLEPKLRHERLQAARAAYGRGNTQAALINLRHVVPTGRNPADFFTDVGDELVSRGRPELAVSEYRRALAVEPLYVDTRLRLARALHACGQTLEAVIEAQKCLEANPRYDEARALLAQWADPSRPQESVLRAMVEPMPRAG